MKKWLASSAGTGSQREQLDIVDARDAVIGRAERGEVHARGWRHRAVHCLLRDGDGRVLLQLRSTEKETWPGTWDSSAAGHVAAGDDYLVTAIREIEEEIGLRVEAAALEAVGRLDPSEATGWEFIRIYVGPLPAGEACWQPGEVDGAGLFAPAEVDGWLQRRPEAFSGVFRLVWPVAKAVC